MNYCKECNIKISVRSEKCPICSGSINNIDSEFIEPYPKIEIDYRHFNSIRLRIYLFLAIIVFFFVISVKFLTETDLTYLFLSTSVFGYIWFNIYTIHKALKNVGYFILKQMLFLSGITLLIDYSTGYRGWSVNYAIPLIIILAISSISAIAMFKPMQFREYFVYQITTSESPKSTRSL